MNYRLTLQYDGTDFRGWQMQANAERTVQGELVRALSLLEGDAVVVHGAGRTDAGVHAEAQVASARMQRAFAPEKLRAAINGNLAADVRVSKVECAPDDFHARFSARGKTYRYRIVNAPFISPFWSRYALHEARAIDFAAMQGAAQIFVGAHDWTAFSCAQAETKTRARTVTQCEIFDATERLQSAFGAAEETKIFEIFISAEGFLRYMARSIVGALVAIGRGEIDEKTIKRALTTGERHLAITTAPARGLTLVKVEY
jgi:tRNA pseudouridine38-40 synthase